jgi:hypothetical protein
MVCLLLCLGLVCSQLAKKTRVITHASHNLCLKKWLLMASPLRASGSRNTVQ